MKKENLVRVFARKLASELTHQELASISGQGTSYYGTGTTDAAGRKEDWNAGDSTQGWDRYYPY